MELAPTAEGSSIGAMHGYRELVGVDLENVDGDRGAGH